MYNKVVNTYASTMQFVPEYYKKFVIKLLILVFFVLNSVPDRYKIQEMRDK